MYAKLSELPECIQRELKNNDYHKKDICIDQTTSVSPVDYGGDGRKAYFMAIDLETGQRLPLIDSGRQVDILRGSWGGANMFNPSNRVDLDDGNYTIPDNAVVIKGHIGYKPYATLYIRPDNAPKFIRNDCVLNERQLEILACMRSYTSAYRKEVYEKMDVKDSEFQALADSGHIKISKNGAKHITTEGKNACLNVRVY